MVTLRGIVIFLAAIVLPTAASGSTILGPAAVSSSSPADALLAQQNDFALGQTIDQSGLSANYVSGVTDFDTFVATTTAANANFSIGGRSGLPEPVLFDYDLGDVYSVSDLAIWNQSGTAGLKTFSLFADTLADFSTAVLIGTYEAAQGTVFDNYASLFAFAPVNGRFFRVQATANYGLVTGSVRLNEIAFGGGPVAAVPLPAAFPLLGAGLGAMGLLAWCRQRRSPRT